MFERLAALAGSPPTRLAQTGEQHRWRHFRAELADGRVLFVKVARQDLGGVFEAEALGMRWLAQADAAPVPEVVGWDDVMLAVAWVEPGPPDPAAARRFGAELARMHRAGAENFGAPWPGFIASLPLPNDPGPAGSGWAEWYAACRVEPYLRRAADAGTLSAADVALVEAVLARVADLAGPPEPPARIHGDCWAGNVLWSGGRGWLIDPAAHGGHRETDLAMLALFGAPHLDRIVAGYQEEAPLEPGWQARVPLHQLHPLLVHVCLFGAGYRDGVVAAARTLLAA